MNTIESLKKSQDELMAKYEARRKKTKEVAMQRLPKLEEFCKSHPLSLKEFEEKREELSRPPKETPGTRR